MTLPTLLEIRQNSLKNEQMESSTELFMAFFDEFSRSLEEIRGVVTLGRIHGGSNVGFSRGFGRALKDPLCLKGSPTQRWSYALPVFFSRASVLRSVHSQFYALKSVFCNYIHSSPAINALRTDISWVF